MDDDVHRFDGQAKGLAHHTLADAFYRNLTLDWMAAQRLMADTFYNSTEGKAFVSKGVVGPAYTHTLDLAGAAFATSQVAARTNKTLSAAMLRISGNWANVYNASTCLLKNTSEAHYYEGTYVNYGFRPLTNMAARIKLCGADAGPFIELLDAFFGYGREPSVQLPIYSDVANGVPQWYRDVQEMGFASHTFEGLCNEPDMETPYTYAYAGRADRVQEVVTAVKTYSYGPGRGGLAGNDDSGGEAAWFVWAAVGIFPIAGQPVYIIGSPSFSAIIVHLGSASLKIQREGVGSYIQSGLLNGVSLGGRAWMSVDEVHAGGTLVLTVGKSPGKEWGVDPPPSYHA